MQLMVDTVTLEIGLNVLLTVKEELKQELEPVQTLLLITEELAVLGQAVKPENAIIKGVQVNN